MSSTNTNNTALTTTINIVPVQGIFDQYHSIITFVGPAGDYFSAPISGVATLTSGTIAATPVNPLDITNKAYVDAVAQGLDIKASVVASTTANITLSGTQTVDTIALAVGDRCLVKNQTAAADNGIYVVAAGAWARSTDMNTWSQVPGAFTFIETGSTLGDTGWVCTSNAGGTIGVTAINWTQFTGGASYSAGTGLTLAGSVFSLTSPVAINLGGTAGTATPTAGAVPYGTGTAYAFTAAGTTGQVLTSATAGTPTWTTPFAGITVTDDTTTNATRYPLFTSATTGTITGNNTSSTKLSFNPSTGVLSVAGLTSTGAITYGGVTLTNAVTGTGKMVLDTTPTIATPVLTNPTVTAYLETAPAIVNSSTAQTIALASGTVLSYTLTGNCTFTMPATTNGTSFIVRLIQDGTGSRTATFTGVKWPGGTVPTITTTATTGVDILSFVCIASVWYGNAAQAFA